ncbi:hypothetical protein F503_05809 [Ophiostoma piceae UAMH 11346]|uniref:Uncharacterized protein n=1 Tax=Ophiostoma piceae (strain UAMH 11346) TaxID=1262450 RepID=S3CB47_OPHP1|nr:hypothetical protein F503_05809 [Ophiostoma piceae UAMH 11346]
MCWNPPMPRTVALHIDEGRPTASRPPQNSNTQTLPLPLHQGAFWDSSPQHVSIMEVGSWAIDTEHDSAEARDGDMIQELNAIRQQN